MTKRKIRIVGEKILRKISEPVSKMTPELKKLIEDMFETMEEANGIGLAAPQVGVAKRIIVINVPTDDEGTVRRALVNPEITRYSDEDDISEEGCLSVPGLCAEVRRPRSVSVRALDGISRKKTSFDASGLVARCIMHEIDHLNGKLFIDEAGIPEQEAIKIIAPKKEEKKEESA